MLRSRLLTTTNSTIFTRSVLKEKWELYSAVCVERKSQIVPETTALQKEFATQLQASEFEKSYKFEYKIRDESELTYHELIKKGDVDAVVSANEIAQGLLDRGLDELGKFQFVPLITYEYRISAYVIIKITKWLFRKICNRQRKQKQNKVA